MQEKITKSKKVSILNNSQVIEILGDNFVNAIKIEKDKKEETLAVQGIFVEIGLIPNSDFAVDLNKTKSREIKVNNKNETNIPGIFAAGDVTDVFEKQIIIAAGEGAKATLSVFRYLSSRK
jgi:alkyl hydroperoxide reductase subunit F